MNTVRILIVEDEASLRRFLVPTLSREGYQVLTAATAAEGIAMARSHNPDLAILDLGLPDGDGFQVLRSIREWSRRPVLILSARTQESEKVRALDEGADDYLTKPFGAAELLARIRVALRRSAAPHQAPVLEHAGLKVDLDRREVSLEGQILKLTPIEYRLVESLARLQGKVATHARLLQEVWGPGAEGQVHYIRIYMARLRHKLEPDPNRPKFLITEPGVGYRLIMD
jgi:two-component system KDP operon response regulator KdpE